MTSWFVIWWTCWAAVALPGILFVATRKSAEKGLRTRQLIAVVIWPLSFAVILFLLAAVGLGAGPWPQELFMWMLPAASPQEDE